MIINLGYINENKNKKKNDKFNIDMKFVKSNKEIINKQFSVESEEIPQGEELSKLIINNYLLNNKYLNDEEKIKLSLKYQILTKYTSFFTEVELLEKAKGELQLEILGEDKAHIITKENKKRKK